MEEGKGFYWERHPEPEKACLSLLHDCKQKNRTLARLEEKIVRQTSSQLPDWVDHLYLGNSKQARERITGLGFLREPGAKREAYYYPGALLPSIVLAKHSPADHELGVALRVDSISTFLEVNGLRANIEGSLLGRYRRAFVGSEGGVGLMVVERRGAGDYEPVPEHEGHVQTYLAFREAWQTRARMNESEDDAFAEMFRIADRMIGQLGHDMAAHIVCRSELKYWLSRNFAARVQQGRHDTLGLGWANHDHYTFRSSRKNFSRLVKLFSTLGFLNRERFYAGAEAGWGAQVMENRSGLTLFLDVDLEPDEVDTDFSRDELKPAEKLGTVGLWCALHGDSILQAGMHHVAARYEFERLVMDIAQYGVEYMPPFSNFSYLKQAFSTAERWRVEPGRIETLRKANAITQEQGDRFSSDGAAGSHLENIQRREGYKGFNRKNVSTIIRETDPRRLAA